MDDDQRNTESNIEKKSSQQPGIDKGNKNNGSSANSIGVAKAGASATTSSLKEDQEEHVPLHQQNSSTGDNPPCQEIIVTDGKGKDEMQAKEDPRSQPSEEIDRFPEKVRKQTRSATITRISHLLSIGLQILTMHSYDPASTDNLPTSPLAHANIRHARI